MGWGWLARARAAPMTGWGHAGRVIDADMFLRSHPPASPPHPPAPQELARCL